MSRSVLLLSAVLLVAAGACESAPVDVPGPCADAFKGQLCLSAKTQGKATTEVSLVVPMASIENAPSTEGEMQWPPKPDATLEVPDAVKAGSGFTNFTMYWEAGGHPPAPFMQPHFDFHFYLVPNADRLAIDCVDSAKPAALPTGYELHDEPLPPDMAKMLGVSTLVGICVPQMGMHALPADEVAGKTPFHGDMVIGYFKGKAVFIEPMITKAMLMEKKSFDLNIPAIPGYSGAHPTVFHAVFDATKNAYTFTFSNFAPAA